MPGRTAPHPTPNPPNDAPSAPRSPARQAPANRIPRPATTRAPGPDAAKIVLPVRYSAWLSGDIGRSLQKTLENGLEGLGAVRITVLPRAFLVEADEAPGPLLEAVSRAARDLERAVETAYPVFHHEMGPVWNGTLQAVFA